MKDLPVRKVPGVGKVNEHILAGLNIYNCKDMIEKATEIYATFTEWAFERLIKSAMGISRHEHSKECFDVQAQKSMGVSSTFKPIHRYGEFVDKIIQLSAELEVRSKDAKLMGRSLVLEYKDFKFQTRIKSMTFPHYLFNKNQFVKYAVFLLNRAWPISACRLLALRLQGIRKRE